MSRRATSGRYPSPQMATPDRSLARRLDEGCTRLAPVALAAWILLPYLRLDRWVTGFDTAAYSGPNLVVSLEAIREGRLPQWNTDIFGGITHIGNAQAAVFEPLMWLASPLPTHRALSMIIVAHVVILALGMWWLLRHRLSLSLHAAALGTLAMTGSGLVMSRSLQFEQIAVVSWVPWVLVGVDLSIQADGRRSRLVVLPLAGALVAVSGHPQQVLIALPLVAVWTVGRFLDVSPGWAGVRRLAGAGVLAVGIAAAQLFPVVLSLGSSAIVGDRSLADASNPTYSAQIRRLPGTIFGDVTQTVHPFTTNSFEAMGFVGAIAGALALLGLLAVWPRRDRWTMAALVGAAAFGTICAVGPRTVVYRVMYRVVPGFDLARVPGRWMLLVVLSAAILAAVGLDRLGTDALRSPRVIVAACALGAITAATWWGPFERPLGGGVVWWVIAFALVTGAALAAARWPAARAVALVGLVIAASVELGVMSRHSFAREVSLPQPFTDLGTELTDFLADKPGRTLALSDDRRFDPGYLVPSLRPNTNAALGVPSIDGYDGGTQVTTRWVQAVSALMTGRIDPQLRLHPQVDLPVSTEISARLGVRWLVVDTDQILLEDAAPDWGAPLQRSSSLVVVENPDWLGEATLLRRSVGAPAHTPRSALRDTPGDTVVLEEGAPALRCPRRCTPVAANARRPHSGAIDVTLPADAAGGVLVVDEQLASGWSATVDGRRAPLEEANGLFIGVRVPDGARQIALRYEAPGLVSGLRVSGVASLIVVALLLPGRTLDRAWARARRPRRGAHSAR